MVTLNINIVHIAAIREARKGVEPSPVLAAQKAMLAGADGIVAHLREDRRHINDNDVRNLRKLVDTRFDLEMAATDEIINIALDVVPDLVTIVPEKRDELTTEGGLNIHSDIHRFAALSKSMHNKNILVSYFIEPEISQIDAAKKVGADIIELHTGTYANNFRSTKFAHEYARIKKAAEYAESIGLHIAAGHGLNYNNIKPLLKISQIKEYSIGHSIISRASITGIDSAVRDMLHIIQTYSRL
ncbi:pyridoxine 5'-phosphate synthase [Candidatus Kapaibacterium sp.]